VGLTSLFLHDIIITYDTDILQVVQANFMIFEKTFYENKITAVKLREVQHFSPDLIFDCGQSFRFDKVEGSHHESEFAGVAHGKYISVAKDGSDVYIYNTDEQEFYSLWCNYFGLDRNYADINSSILSLSSNPALADAIEKSSGIRILKQDPWEALCSFIISQNNNIPRIKSLICAISAKCGCECDLSGMEAHIAASHKNILGATHTFPTPQSLFDLGEEGLRELKTGFRAKYIMDASSRVISGQTVFSDIDAMPTKKATDELCKICGVGPKVASCALLFGHSKLDAFPIDVWIKKVIAKYFDESFDPTALGEYAGVAQQYLFYYERYLQNT